VIYAYQWLYSDKIQIFTEITVSGDGPDYQPSAALAAVFFRRRVISGKWCI
jgi:hypothetical protein